MTTGIVPPTQGSGPDQARPDGPRRTAPRVIAVLTASLGVAVLAASLAGAALPTIAESSPRSEDHEVDVEGITSLEVDVSATSLTVVFDDVQDAALHVRDAGASEWTFERDGDALRVVTPRGPFASWFRAHNGQATLTLPDELAGIDAELAVGGGSVDAEGEFGDLGLDVGAGEIHVTGEAETVVAEVSAGRGDVELDGVSTAEFSLGAGELIARLTGDAPDDVRADVSAGSLQLTLPDQTYDVTTEVSAGQVDNELRTEDDAPRSVFIDVSAGEARLRPAGR
jgi:hypothetical protein